MDSLDNPEARDPFRTLDGHSVILYGSDEPRLIDHVVNFLYENLAQDYPVLVVATQSHRQAFSAALRAKGVDPAAASRAGLLVYHDALTVLGEILVDGRVERRVFDRIVCESVRNLRMRGPLRIYGEMVGVLWAQGQGDTAIELEALWNRFRMRVDFELLCGYQIDIFGSAFAINSIDGIIRAHGEVSPYGGVPGHVPI